MAAQDTPVMRQHAEAKQAHPDAIVFFRLGDFYEMFGADATVAAPLLDLVLTSRNKGAADEIPMCGVPAHAAHNYIARLLQAGHRVAICEQMADPQKCRGLVPREVVRVVTSGLVTEEEHLQAKRNNWLCAIEPGSEGFGLALLDLSTAELCVARLRDGAEVLSEVGRAAPSEILIGGEGPVTEELAEALRVVARRTPLHQSGPELEVESSLGELVSETATFETMERRALARVLDLARACFPKTPLPVQRVTRLETGGHLLIDDVAQAHLELVQSSSGDKQTTLLAVLDDTRTAMGARLLRRRLLMPLLDAGRIRRRLDLVELFVIHSRLRGQLREALGGIADLERLSVRASMREATPRDLGAIRDALTGARTALAVLDSLEEPGAAEILGTDRPVDVLPELCEELTRALVERPRSQAKEGAIFRPEYDARLAAEEELCRDGASKLVELEARLREQTQMGSLKLRFTRVFGWYAEVPRAQVGRVPSTWRRKQTVAGGERYTLDELDELAERISRAEERHRQRELELFSELVERVAAEGERLRALATLLAGWDVAANLAELAHRYDYARPEIDEGEVLSITEGRHPVVERLAAAGRFVANDCLLDRKGHRLWLITGPNMAGKSTFLRQVALTVILAQMGSYVPAKQARIGLCDRVHSRVGASDNLARGESTFMVEMRETSQILRSATRRSLVILDEIGRGTSTLDGLSIAWSVAEYLDRVVGCRTLFATHYHELTELAEQSQNIANYSVGAKEWEGEIVFLHRLLEGATNKSYGIAVARLAGLPERVLARARALLSEFEAGRSSTASAADRRQMDLFAPAKPELQPKLAEGWLSDLSQLDLDRMTPLEALSLLCEWQARLKPKS
jgi:DNA mismatch repair protein MutS